MNDKKMEWKDITEPNSNIPINHTQLREAIAKIFSSDYRPHTSNIELGQLIDYCVTVLEGPQDEYDAATALLITEMVGYTLRFKENGIKEYAARM